MKFDAMQKTEASIQENNYVEKNVGKAKKEEISSSKKRFGIFDAAIIATGVGAFVSFGYLCFNIAKMVTGVALLGGVLTSLG